MTRRPSIAAAWTGLALVVAVVCIYAPVLGYGFVTFDDPEYVTKNPHVRAGLGYAGIVWAFSQSYAANWHPLTWCSHMLDWSLFGAWPGGHHLTNVLLHAASTAVLFTALVRATRAPWESAVATALFALHPLRVESVAWVSERKDVLAALAWTASMLAYARYAERPNRGRYAAVAALFVVGLLAKPMVVTLPFALVLLDVWPFERVRREGWRRVLLEKTPLLALSGGAAVLTYLAQSAEGAVASLEHQPFGWRVANALVSYVTYCWKTIWPARLAVFYPPASAFGPATIAGAAAFLAAVTGLVVWQRSRRPYLLVGWLWFLGTLVPVIGIVRAGDQAMADRFTYLPSIGLGFMAAWSLGEIARRDARAWWTTTGAVALVAVAWCVQTSRQLATWRDSHALYEHALAVTEGNHLAHGNLGLLLLDEGHVDAARAHFAAAVAARPTAPKAHVNMGVGLASVGRHAEALAEYEAAARLDPRLAVAQYNMGLELATLGRPDEAAARYEEAIRLAPGYGAPHVNLGLLFANQGRFDEAIAHYRRAIALDPSLYAAYNNLAVALERTGAVGEAVDAYRAAVRTQPDDPRARFNLASVLLGQGAAGEAATEFRQVVRLDPDNAEARAALGEALAASGDVPGAVTAFRAAVERRPDWAAARARLAELEGTAPAGATAR